MKPVIMQNLCMLRYIENHPLKRVKFKGKGLSSPKRNC